jgi:predicted metalloprotease
MRWRQGRQSANVEDRRGMSAGGRGFGRGARVGGGGLGKLGLGGVIVVLALGYFLTGDPMGLLVDGGVSMDPSSSSESAAPGAMPDDEGGRFASAVLADTEDTWTRLFEQMGERYRPPVLVLFSDAVQSACGYTDAAVGPFYCPGDHKAYIDLSFFNELERRFGAPGDFARAYVIAHEIGHHVQNLLGVFDLAVALRRRGADANDVSIRQELQADCLAGVWAHFAGPRMLDPGDIDEGLAAAAAIGDDRIQRQTQGRVTPETWTHGSSEQRVAWFRQGLEQGKVGVCDTFTNEGR